MRSRDDAAKRKRRDYPHFCTIEIPADWSEWTALHARMEDWARKRTGPTGFVKHGRMASDRNLVDWRFKGREVAAEFQADFGGELGGEQPTVGDRAAAPRRHHRATAGQPPTSDESELAAEEEDAFDSV